MSGGGTIRYTARLYRATIGNAFVEELTDDLVDGTVDLNYRNAIKRSLRVTLRRPGRVTPYVDYLAPVVTLSYDDGRADVTQQLGLFAVSAPQGSRTLTDNTGVFDGQDLTGVLAQDALVNVANVTADTDIAAGTNVATALGTLIGTTITRTAIPSTSRVLGNALSFKTGTSRLEACNQLLSTVGWYELETTVTGVVKTDGAVVPLAQLEPWRTLTEADVIGRVEIAPVNALVANVVVVTASDTTNAPVGCVKINDDPQSKTSTVTTGRRIVRTLTLPGEASAGECCTYASRVLEEGSSFYRAVRLNVLPDPTVFLGRKAVQLRFSGGLAAINGLYWIRAASIGLTPGQALVALDCNQLRESETGDVL